MASKSKNGFLPEGYEVPSGGGGYTQLKAGDTKLRVLSNPLFLWIVWEDGKVKRVKYEGKDSKPPKPTTTQKDSVKHAWAVIVYNYETKQIEIFEIDKATIQASLKSLSDSEDWGHPKEYDLKINKKGSGLDTEYTVLPLPKTEPSDELVQAYTDTPINLDNLLEGKDPFIRSNGDESSTQKQVAKEKVVTADNWTEGDEPPAGYKVEKGKLVKKKLPF